MIDTPTVEQIARWERYCSRTGVYAPEYCSFEEWARTAASWERQTLDYQARDLADYGDFAMAFEPRPPEGMNWLHWVRSAEGRAKWDAFWGRRREIGARCAEVYEACHPASEPPSLKEEVAAVLRRGRK